MKIVLHLTKPGDVLAMLNQIADFWGPIRQELSDLKTANSTLTALAQDQARQITDLQGRPVMSDADQAAAVEMKAEADSLAPPPPPGA